MVWRRCHLLALLWFLSSWSSSSSGVLAQQQQQQQPQQHEQVATRKAQEQAATVGSLSDTTSSSSLVLRVNVASDVETLYDNGNGVHEAWHADNAQWYHGGQVMTTNKAISGTPFAQIYQTARFGQHFEYDVPVAAITLDHTSNNSSDSGNSASTPAAAVSNDDAHAVQVQVALHFCEISPLHQVSGARTFHVYVEDELILNAIDVYSAAGHTGYASHVVNVQTVVKDGALSLEFVGVVGEAMLSAFEVTPIMNETGSAANDAAVGVVEPHYAHAVPGGPYVEVDTDNDGWANITVDGTFSHTHLFNAVLVRWTWMVTNPSGSSNNNDNSTSYAATTKIVGTNDEVTTFALPVGVYNLTLEVEDDGGYNSTDYTTVTVLPFGYPSIKTVSPSMVDVGGDDTLTIVGSGFNYSTQEMTVYIGATVLSNSDIRVLDFETIEVMSTPSSTLPGVTELIVETPFGRSMPARFTYFDETLPPIQFSNGTIAPIRGPTCLAFGPNGKDLYVGTQLGHIVRLTLDDNYQVVDELTSKVVAESEDVRRVILGIAFDPLDTSDEPTVYVSHSWLFHQLDTSFNGKVSAVSGPNLDQLRHVVTGLPVSDHDHGVNGILFGDNGELYIQVPGNTNAGVIGPLSSRKQLDEEFLSAATVVASNVTSPSFDGNITYDDYGNPISGHVNIFASGLRNSYGMILHSNGYLYATDNGANRGYGKQSVSCNEDGPSPHDPDELNLVEEGHYYGHANRKRGQTDPRQCKYRSTNETKSDDDYTAPLMRLPASSNGLCEFETEHFAGQLRGNLIISRWKGELFNIALTEDGRAVQGATAGSSNDTSDLLLPPVLIDEDALDVVQGPDGTLFTAKHQSNIIKFYSPVEVMSKQMRIKSIFPRRGSIHGGTSLTVYGDNLFTFGVPTVMVGGKDCPMSGPMTSDAKLTCTLPPFETIMSNDETVDIIVTAAKVHSTILRRGYRYIAGGGSDGDGGVDTTNGSGRSGNTNDEKVHERERKWAVPSSIATNLSPRPPPSGQMSSFASPPSPPPLSMVSETPPESNSSVALTMASSPSITTQSSELVTKAAATGKVLVEHDDFDDPAVVSIDPDLVVWRLVWVNADTDKDIGPVTRLCNGCLSDDAITTIRADVWGNVNSVHLILQGPAASSSSSDLSYDAIENHMPHCLFGNDDNPSGSADANADTKRSSSWNYHGKVFTKGKYTITAQAFSGPNGQGLASKRVEMQFEIV